MVTISGSQKKFRAEPSIRKYGAHFQECVRKTTPYCRKNKRKGETTAQCAQGICHFHMSRGHCAIDTVHKFNVAAKRNRARPSKQYLARLKKQKREKARRKSH